MERDRMGAHIIQLEQQLMRPGADPAVLQEREVRVPFATYNDKVLVKKRVYLYEFKHSYSKSWSTTTCFIVVRVFRVLISLCIYFSACAWSWKPRAESSKKAVGR